MATRKIEGTFSLDGLLEGPLFSEEDESIINAFVKQTRGAGLKFHAAIDGARFSLLADTESVEIGSGGKSAHVRLERCLNTLLSNYSPEECMQLMSTLRSVEYISGREIQTLYGIKPDCTAALEQRTVRANTLSRAARLDRRSKVRLAVFGAVFLCAAIGISAFFVPYSKIAKRAIEKVKPFSIDDLTIDSGAYDQFFKVDQVDLDRSEGVIRIVCRASAQYPATEDELNTLWKSSGDSVSQRLVVEALMRNCVRCEFFDRDGNFRDQRVCYIRWREGKKKVFSIVIPFNRYLGRVKIGY